MQTLRINRLWTWTFDRELRGWLLRLLLTDMVIIGLLYVLPVAIIKPIHFYVLVDSLIRFGLGVITFVVILIASARISRQRLARQGRKLKVITRLLMAALAVVFVQLLVWLFGIDVDQTRSVSFGNLNQVDQIEVSVRNSRNPMIISDRSIIKQLSQIADTNRRGYLELVDGTGGLIDFELSFYSKGQEVANLGVGDGVLTGSSFTYKYVPIDLTNKIRKLAGIP